ncbi:MAG: hypothetical protein EON96_02195 [Caulobacteraceae bacterium]|nr:MAG: hypothetical protein EON96_02195 [Caulobacteraceae bacterium]
MDDSEVPVPPTMLPLEEAALLFTGWSAGEGGNRAVLLARSRVGQTFAAGRNISTAATVLEHHAKASTANNKISGGFTYSTLEQSYFVDFEVARKLLIKAPLSQHFLSEPMERLFRQHAWADGAKPSYAQLEAENAALARELAATKGSHKAATIRRANRMLEGLKALEGLAKAKWSKSREELLDFYDDKIVSYLDEKAEWNVPTRYELERWIKDRPSAPRRPAQNRKAAKSASSVKSADPV